MEDRHPNEHGQPPVPAFHRDSHDRQQLIEFRERVGENVIHAPYTDEFEAVCRHLGATSRRKKHDVWEKLVATDMSDAATSDVPQVPTAHESATNDSAQSAATLAGPPAIHPVEDDAPSLFDLPNTETSSEPSPHQSWTVPPEPALDPELYAERMRLLADVAESRLGTTEQRILYLLQQFPETRDSDIWLCIRYWRRFQADVIERWNPMDLEILFDLDRIETIGRMRRHIQNALRLCRGTEDISNRRSAIQQEFHQYLAAEANALPEVRFYLDETGNEGGKAYTGVAGLCVMNWKQFEKHHAALYQWRYDQHWPETIHFADTGTSRLDRAIALLGRLRSRRGGLLFVGYAMQSRGQTRQAIFSLFVHLVIDALRHLKSYGLLGEVHSLRVVKEAEIGFDELHLQQLHMQIESLVALEFPGQFAVQPIESVPKGREVMLECADLVAGGMQRRALFGGNNPKDRLAEAVANVTGFDDSTDNGAVFRHYS